jgi:F-type H+-transporting ATPase subunit epsilon
VNLEIITPDKTLFTGKIKSINVPGTKGSFTILHNHAPLISTLEKGKLKIITEDLKTEVIEIIGGVIEIKKNIIIVLAEVV